MHGEPLAQQRFESHGCKDVNTLLVISPVSIEPLYGCLASFIILLVEFHINKFFAKVATTNAIPWDEKHPHILL